MKRFDPSIGWIQAPGESDVGAPDTASHASSSEPAALPHPASVYHFNRQGARLHVTRVEDGPQAAPVPSVTAADTAASTEAGKPASAQSGAHPGTSGGAQTVSPAVQRMREAAAHASQQSLRAPAETAGMVRELFERLDEADASQVLMARVADNLKTLDDLAVRKGQLERVLADIAQEMDQLKAQVRTDLDAARESEARNLKLRQYRRELLEQLASRLQADGRP